MSDTCKYNCSAHPKEIQAYGDISGIGVTVAFFVTAWIIVFLLIGYYLVVYNPELDPFRETGKKTPCRYPNAIDYVFLHAFRKLLLPQRLRNADGSRHSQVESALNNCVMMYSDIQIFSGLAVMISGYHALRCGLQSYHWQLTVYLVWLSSLTHLAALSFLRNHLANNTRQLIWRVIAMFAIMVLLEVAVGLAGHFNWGKGSNKASDFAVCYFREKMDRSSVAFETMLKTLTLLAYGFFIRLAKMSKRFEGRLRSVATRLSAKAMRLQHEDGEDSPPQDSQGSSTGGRSISQQLRHYFLVAFYSSLSIHLNLFTSFLAEVYWLTLSASWVTRRFVKVRKLGSKEENEWTFGQILPLLLVVAPLAAVLEQFFPCQASNNTRSRSPDRIALLTRDQSGANEAQNEAQDESRDQPETDEARDDVRVEMDHQHIHSMAYRGAFFLAAVAYIEVGIFFVADLSPGIKEPLIRLGVAFFVLNPLLQFLWIHCTLWTSRIKWSSVVKKTVRGAILGASTSISVNEFIQASTTRSSNNREPVYTSLTSSAALACSLFLSEDSLRQNLISEGERRLFNAAICIAHAIAMFAVCVAMAIISSGNDDPLAFVRSFAFCVGLELAYCGYELFLEKINKMPSRVAFFSRCLLLFGFTAALAVLQLSTSIAPGTTLLTASTMASACCWSLFGTIVALFRRRRTVARDESAASTT